MCTMFAHILFTTMSFSFLLYRDGRKAGTMIAAANKLQGNNVTLTKSFFLFYTRCVPSVHSAAVITFSSSHFVMVSI